MINLKTLFGLKSFLRSSDRFLNLDLNLCVDNRDLNHESIFVAIIGTKYNPLDHLDIVLDKGCRFVVYEKSMENDSKVEKYRKSLVLIEVSSIFNFIQEAGRAVANTFKTRGGKIIAISGSNGKTTTKEMLTYLLSKVCSERSVIATQKNNNNHLGVPFTLFQINQNTQYAVVELGSNHPGEIEHLCQILRPQYGVTTNIGDTHLEFFGSRDEVFKEEASLVNFVSHTFFVNDDDEFLKGLVGQLNGTQRVLSFGHQAKDFTFNLDMPYSVNKVIVANDNILGRHNFTNLLLAISICHVLTDKNIRDIVSFAADFSPTFNRSQWTMQYGTKIFLDAYNANPSSMKLAVDEFLYDIVNIKKEFPQTVCLILGDMNELGKNEKSFHEEFGKNLNGQGIGLIIFVGRFADSYAKHYRGEYEKYASAKDVKKAIVLHAAKYKYIFIKGSRSLQLETILDIK